MYRSGLLMTRQCCVTRNGASRFGLLHAVLLVPMLPSLCSSRCSGRAQSRAYRNRSNIMSTTPRLDAYSVRKYTDRQSGEERSDWTRVGVAWPHSDGKGLNVHLSAMPVDGVLVLRNYEVRQQAAAEAPVKGRSKARAA
jgi:hypothetical protein